MLHYKSKTDTHLFVNYCLGHFYSSFLLNPHSLTLLFLHVVTAFQEGSTEK